MDDEYLRKDVFNESMKRIETLISELEKRQELANKKRDEIFAQHLARIRDYVDARLSRLDFILALAAIALAIIELVK